MHLSFSRRLSVFLCVILASSLFAQTKSADVPRVIRYSGTLTNVDGTPRTGTLGVSFAIYADDKSTAPLWQEVVNVVPDAQGHYTVLLGAARSEGLPAELFATNDARWLGIRVENEQEQPRAILAAVPYALKAADAETLGGKPLSAFVLNESTTNGRTADTGGTTSGSGSGSKTGLHPMSVDTTNSGGTQNTIAKWTDAGGTILGNSLLTDTGTAVGLNNTSPTTALDVTGTIRSVLSPSAPFGPYMLPTAGSANSFHFGFGYNLYFDGTNWRTKGDGVHNGGSAFLSDTGSGNMVVMSVPSTGAADQTISDTTFNTMEKFRITSAGNVGINNTSPVTTLDVAGTIRSVLSASAPFGPSMIPTAGAANTFHFGYGYNMYFDGTNWRTKGDGAHNGGAAFLSDTGTGNLGVYTVASTGASDQVISDTTFNTMQKVLITPNGRLGIGISNPQQLLDVGGNINASGNVTATGTISGANLNASGFVAFTGTPTGSGAGPVVLINPASASAGQTLFEVAVGGSQRMLVDSGGNLTAAGTLAGTALALPNTTSSTTGVLTINSAPFLHAYGLTSVFVGGGAGNFTTQSAGMVGIGAGALANVTTTTFDPQGLPSAPPTAVGYKALAAATTDWDDTAVGYKALMTANSGGANTAVGAFALSATTGGNSNTAVGANALLKNINGGYNTAVGHTSMRSATTANNNTALGYNTLASVTNASNNVAIGNLSGQALTTGSDNIVIGNGAGQYLTTGSGNIYIGTYPDPGSDESDIARIGNSKITATYIAGIRGTTTSTNDAVAVLIDSTGNLGTTNSSREFKEDIADMGAASDRVMKLRPVTFRYKKSFSDGSKPIQYGLIAEEVAQTFPELAAYGPTGKIETVKYHLLPVLLLEQAQKQEKQIESQDETIQQQGRAIKQQNEVLQLQAQELRDLRKEVEALKAQMAKR